MSKLNHNRAICSGDRGINDPLPRLSKREKAEFARQSRLALEKRMEPWSDNFLKRIARENTSPLWREVAAEVLKTRHKGRKR